MAVKTFARDFFIINQTLFCAHIYFDFHMQENISAILVGFRPNNSKDD